MKLRLEGEECKAFTDEPWRGGYLGPLQEVKEKKHPFFTRKKLSRLKKKTF